MQLVVGAIGSSWSPSEWTQKEIFNFTVTQKSYAEWEGKLY